MQTLRTPEERFAELPDFPYAPRCCEVDDDEGGTLRICVGRRRARGRRSHFHAARRADVVIPGITG